MSLDETKLFEIIPVDSFILKTDYFDFETAVNPSGTLVVATTAVNVANLGLPDYFVDISLLGCTYVECDPDKSIIRKMHSDVLTAVQAWTPELVTAAFGLVAPARVCGVINITSSISSDKSKNAFRLDVRLVFTDLDLQSENFIPAAHLGAAYLVDETTDVDTKTAYICYSNRDPRPITRVITRNAAFNKLIEITYGYGAWEERKELVYTRN